MRDARSPIDGIMSPFGVFIDGSSAFSPVSLFTSGSQGVWYDPSDLTTMFTDSAGTIPVTAPGQTVGKRLDKSGRGNHATAPTDTSRLIYGVEPKTGRRNALTFTEQFNNANWIVNVGISVTANSVIAPDGTTTADLVTKTAADASFYQNVTVTPNTQYVFSFYALAGTSSNNYYSVYNNTGAADIVALTSYQSSLSSSTWARVSVAFTTPTGCTSIRVFTNRELGSVLGTVFLWGAQLELGSTATAYQRVTTAYDVTEAGVPTCHYCQYDGVDDSMSTAAIDFTATDKMSVFAGVRKLSDGSYPTIIELSANSDSSNGAFLFAASRSGALQDYFFQSRGTSVGGAASSAIAAPASNVIVGLADIVGDRATLRVNGAQASQSTADQGTGNFGNYPLFIGRRSNATSPFNGKDYGIIVVGKATSAAEIASTEAYLAANTSGVTLP